LEVEEMHDWRQRAETVREMIDELRVCFANISASAQSLSAKVQQNGESSLKRGVEEIIQIAKSMEEKLSCFSRACRLLAEASPINSHESIRGKLPDFAEYVCLKYGVSLEEDLVTMIEDLIERQKQKVKAERQG